ncbi:hypothetical protein GW17_00053803, partial [Ensete ventricosum]
HVAPSLGVQLKPRWKRLIEDQQLWEEVGVIATYYRGPQPVLVGLAYHCLLDVLADLYSRKEVLVTRFGPLSHQKCRARMEEARDEAATTEDMAVESIVEGEQHIGALHHELKDAHWQLGKVIKRRLLEEQLLTMFNELVVAQLAIEEAKGAWEDLKNQASE